SRSHPPRRRVHREEHLGAEADHRGSWHRMPLQTHPALRHRSPRRMGERIHPRLSRPSQRHAIHGADHGQPLHSARWHGGGGMTTPLKVLLLGAGVQSTTVLLMSCRGLLPKLDAAVFADTQWEPSEVYEHLEWLTGEAAIAGI